MRALFYRIGRFGEALKNGLPPGLESFVMDVFFGKCPIWLICRLWPEAGGYLKMRSPVAGDTVIDAGAWKGHFSVIASRLVGPAGKVIAVEPQREMCERLRDRLRRLSINNVHVVHAGLYDREGELRLPRRTCSDFNLFAAATGSSEFELVKLTTLDRMHATLHFHCVNFVKMDIEGAEIEALLGGAATISAQHPFFAIASYHVREGRTTSAHVEAILRGSGYCTATGHRSHLTTWGWWGSSRVHP